jgi:hypothetical protein
MALQLASLANTLLPAGVNYSHLHLTLVLWDIDTQALKLLGMHRTLTITSETQTDREIKHDMRNHGADWTCL